MGFGLEQMYREYKEKKYIPKIILVSNYPEYDVMRNKRANIINIKDFYVITEVTIYDDIPDFLNQSFIDGDLNAPTGQFTRTLVCNPFQAKTFSRVTSDMKFFEDTLFSRLHGFHIFCKYLGACKINTLSKNVSELSKSFKLKLGGGAYDIRANGGGEYKKEIGDTKNINLNFDSEGGVPNFEEAQRFAKDFGFWDDHLVQGIFQTRMHRRDRFEEKCSFSLKEDYDRTLSILSELQIPKYLNLEFDLELAKKTAKSTSITYEVSFPNIKQA